MLSAKRPEAETAPSNGPFTSVLNVHTPLSWAAVALISAPPVICGTSGFRSGTLAVRSRPILSPSTSALKLAVASKGPAALATTSQTSPVCCAVPTRVNGPERFSTTRAASSRLRSKRASEAPVCNCAEMSAARAGLFRVRRSRKVPVSSRRADRSMAVSPLSTASACSMPTAKPCVVPFNVRSKNPPNAALPFAAILPAPFRSNPARSAKADKSGVSMPTSKVVAKSSDKLSITTSPRNAPAVPVKDMLSSFRGASSA